MAPQFPFPLGVATTTSASMAMATPFGMPAASTGMASAPVGQTMASTSVALGSIDLTKINPYIYKPSFSMAVIGPMAFLLLALVHTIQLIKTRAWYFIVMQNAPLIAAASLVARANSVLTLPTTGATGPFIVFTILDQAVGTVASLGTIFTYTRVMWWVTPDEKRNFSTLWTPPYWTSFCWGLLLFFGDATKAVVQNLLKPLDPLSVQIQTTALAYQFFVLVAFTFTAWRFMMMSQTWAVDKECVEKDWRSLGWTVVLCAALITVRQAFLVVQLDARADPTSYYSQHEWVYWVAESLPLFAIFALFSMSYPGFFLPREYIGFRIKLKNIAAAKRDAIWPLSISIPYPIQGPQVGYGKSVDVAYTETKAGVGY